MVEIFGLYLVMTDPEVGYPSCAEAAVAEGVKYLQLRMKNVSPAEVLRVAREIRAITRGSGTKFIVNDDVDVAAEVDADGVHLGQGDLSVAEARRRWAEPGKIVGLSTHNETEAETAAALGPGYIGVGPVFPTPTKEKPDPTLGLSRMGAIVGASPLTTVCIGGIDESNLGQVIEYGGLNFAVVRAVMRSSRPREAIRRLQDAWKAGMAKKRMREVS